MTRRNDRPPHDGQLPLDLPHRPAMGRDDLLVADSNAPAMAMLDSWPRWPTSTTILVGPEGSGKSHIAEVWRHMSGAQAVTADQLDVAGVPDLCRTGAVLVEDAPGSRLEETALFHLMNFVRENAGHLLITTREFPAHWPVTLRDLASRLRAAGVVSLEPPDDHLLRGVLVKLFADRQLLVDETVINYLILRMERSLGVARDLVDRIDRQALAEKSAVTRNFVARMLNEDVGDLFADN